MKKSAFTLIELLVVIAIIAILAALAIPGLQGAIEKAKATTDTSQLSSLGKMFLRYLGDHEDQMPALGSGGGDSWPQALFKVTPEYKVFVSPFDKRPVTNSTNSPVSYGLNQNTFDTNASDWTTPSQLIFMAPQASGRQGQAPQFNGSLNSNVAVQPGGSTGIYRSGKQINVLFADWHAAPMTYEMFKDVGSVQGQQRWVPQTQ